MQFDEYRSPGVAFAMPPVLCALLSEGGSYIHKLVYKQDTQTTRNPFFAACLHTDAGGRIWKPAALRFQVSLFYELTEEFPLLEDSDEFEAFTATMQSMLPHKINLVPLTAFERCAAVYDTLLEVCAPTVAGAPNEFLCSVRRNDDSFIDLRRRLVMRSRIFERPRELWDSRALDSPSTPCAQRSTWTSFFRDMARIRWYTAYAHAVLSLDAPADMDLYSIGKCKKHWVDLVGKAHVQQDERHLASATISLLEAVEKTYRYNS